MITNAIKICKSKIHERKLYNKWLTYQLTPMPPGRRWPSRPIDHCAIDTQLHAECRQSPLAVDSNSIGSICSTTCCTTCCTTNPQQIDKKSDQWSLSHTVYVPCTSAAARRRQGCCKHQSACCRSLYRITRLTSVCRGEIFLSPEFEVWSSRGKYPYFWRYPNFPKTRRSIGWGKPLCKQSARSVPPFPYNTGVWPTDTHTYTRR